ERGEIFSGFAGRALCPVGNRVRTLSRVLISLVSGRDLDYYLAHPDLFDALFRIESGAQFIFGNLDNLAGFVLVYEKVAGPPLLGVYVEVLLVLVEIILEVSLGYLDLVFELLRSSLDPSHVVVGVALAVVLLDLLWRNHRAGGYIAAQFLFGQRGS